MTQVIVADETASQIPTGEWEIDPVWSALEFEVRKLGLVAIKGRVPGFTGTIVGGSTPSITRRRWTPPRSRPSTRRGTATSSPPTSSTRSGTRRSASSRPRSSRTATGSSSAASSRSRAWHEPVELRGSYAGTDNDPWGNERIGLELAGTVDRTAFGLEWNAPLPGGGFLLPNEVTLRAIFAAVRRS